jgi:hypothetical protein
MKKVVDKMEFEGKIDGFFGRMPWRICEMGSLKLDFSIPFHYFLGGVNKYIYIAK